MKSTYQERPCIPGPGWSATLDGQHWHRLLPMSFTGPNAQKCYDRQKTQTRRLLNPQPGSVAAQGVQAWAHANDGGKLIAPRYRVGEFFYIREPWRTNKGLDNVKPSLLTDAAPIGYEGERTQGYWNGKLRPAMFLQRRFARPARYQITAVRCERVNAISENDSEAEGIVQDDELCRQAERIQRRRRDYYKPCVLGFKRLWDSIHNEPGTRFDDGPWVWAYTFKRVR